MSVNHRTMGIGCLVEWEMVNYHTFQVLLTWLYLQAKEELIQTDSCNHPQDVPVPPPNSL